jgi:hypothetical protein
MFFDMVSVYDIFTAYQLCGFNAYETKEILNGTTII